MVKWTNVHILAFNGHVLNDHIKETNDHVQATVKEQ